MAYFGLYALQHRGQESTGIASYDGKHIRLHAGMGLVPDVYDEATLGQELQGNRAIGHVRYSTSGVSVRKNAQPLVVAVWICVDRHVSVPIEPVNVLLEVKGH